MEIRDSIFVEGKVILVVVERGLEFRSFGF